MLTLALCLVVGATSADRSALIKGATRVQALRLTGESEPILGAAGSRWVTQGVAVELKKPLAAHARSVIVDPKTYRANDAESKCKFTPQVLFRFWRGDKHADVLFSYPCGQAVFIDSGSELPNDGSGVVELGDSDDSRGASLAGFNAMLALTLNPTDHAAAKDC
jgi:hypothetical protein